MCCGSCQEVISIIWDHTLSLTAFLQAWADQQFLIPPGCLGEQEHLVRLHCTHQRVVCSVLEKARRVSNGLRRAFLDRPKSKSASGPHMTDSTRSTCHDAAADNIMLSQAAPSSHEPADAALKRDANEMLMNSIISLQKIAGDWSMPLVSDLTESQKVDLNQLHHVAAHLQQHKDPALLLRSESGQALRSARHVPGDDTVAGSGAPRQQQAAALETAAQQRPAASAAGMEDQAPELDQAAGSSASVACSDHVDAMGNGSSCRQAPAADGRDAHAIPRRQKGLQGKELIRHVGAAAEEQAENAASALLRELEAEKAAAQRKKSKAKAKRAKREDCSGCGRRSPVQIPTMSVSRHLSR